MNKVLHHIYWNTWQVKLTTNGVIDNTQIFSRVFNFSLFNDKGTWYLFYSIIKDNGLLSSGAIDKFIPSVTKESKLSASN